jgi:hypothetical protein
MKINVLKIGANITAANGSLLTDEVHAVIKMLHRCGHDVHYYTIKTRNWVELPEATFHDINDFDESAYNEYDALVVLNGNVNFYGGCETRGDLMTYSFINKSSCPVYYVLTDWLLPLAQMWKGVEDKQVKYEWKNKYTQDQIEITRTDIVMISQIYDIDGLKVILEKREIEYADIVYFPFHEYLVHEYEPIPIIPIEDRMLDLVYGGTFRGGHRQDKMLKYYFGYAETSAVLMFGNIKHKHFNPKRVGDMRYPSFGKKVAHRDFFSAYQKSIATVTISDKKYENAAISNRTNEAILGNVVCFIDREYDPQMKIFRNELTRNFCYVDSREDVESRLVFLKNNPSAFDKLIREQYADVKRGLDKTEFAETFAAIIKERL